MIKETKEKDAKEREGRKKSLWGKGFFERKKKEQKKKKKTNKACFCSNEEVKIVSRLKPEGLGNPGRIAGESQNKIVETNAGERVFFYHFKSGLVELYS